MLCSRAYCAASDLALDAALAEAARHQDAVDVGEDLGAARLLEVLAFDPAQLDARAIRRAGVHERLDDALVGVAHVRVLADHADDAGACRDS